MDKRPIGYKAGKKYFMDKKIPKSKKYANIKGTLNTGKTKEDVDIISKCHFKILCFIDYLID